MSLKNRIQVQEELERLVLQGLSREWETALWVLDPPYRALMRPPLFSLRDMRGRWGYWSGKRREICLSRNLVIDHPWDAVREVLHHEMAHQLAVEVMGVCNERPHGPGFQRACHMLRANPRASGKQAPLDERIAAEQEDPEDSIMLRIKKLMALAESSNRHEAEAAMAKAHEFIARYNLDFMARERDRAFVSVFVGKPALRHPREDYHLATLLQDYYFVKGIWVSAYVLEKGKMGRVLEISGTENNIKTASYVHDFVRNYICLKWNEYNKGRGLNRFRKTDFAVGVIQGFVSRLESRTREKKDTEQSLQLVEWSDPLLLKYIAHRYPHTVRLGQRASRRDHGILRDGIREGKKMVIYRGITKRETGVKSLIQNSNP